MSTKKSKGRTGRQQASEPTKDQPEWPQMSSSPGLATWLQEQRLSIACSSYQTGQLLLVGANPSGGINVDQQYFRRAMGLWIQDDKLWLGTRHQVWRFENVRAELESAPSKFDRVFVPRVAYTTGAVDIHELAMSRQHGLVFANTRFSCLASLDEHHSFAPVWKPPFITELRAEDRCHLNGLCEEDGQIRYVTAAGMTDEPYGWRENKQHGGIIIDVPTGEIVTRGLSMPHSPRLSDGRLYVLDSGRGNILEIDRKSGAQTAVAFGHGFLRGLSIVGPYAVVGSSKPRDKHFHGLPLETILQEAGLEPWCAIMIFDLRTGAMVEWLRFHTRIEETFDVALMPGIRCPMSLGIETEQIATEVTFNANLVA